VERVTGSIAFAALARLVLVAAKVKAETEDDEPRRVLLRAKSNIGPDDGGFAYALERIEVAPEVEGQCVRWHEALEGTARDLLAEAEAQPSNDEASDDAAGFLRGLLAEAPIAAKTIFAEASGAGYSRDQMQRAARRLGVERRKLGMAGGWVWALSCAEDGAEGGEGGTPWGLQPSPSSVPPSAVNGSEDAATDADAEAI
jgi:putative DNA primase/helicase